MTLDRQITAEELAEMKRCAHYIADPSDRGLTTRLIAAYEAYGEEVEDLKVRLLGKLLEDPYAVKAISSWRERAQQAEARVIQLETELTLSREDAGDKLNQAIANARLCAKAETRCKDLSEDVVRQMNRVKELEAAREVCEMANDHLCRDWEGPIGAKIAAWRKIKEGT